MGNSKSVQSIIIKLKIHVYKILFYLFILQCDSVRYRTYIDKLNTISFIKYTNLVYHRDNNYIHANIYKSYKTFRNLVRKLSLRLKEINMLFLLKIKCICKFKQKYMKLSNI